MKAVLMYILMGIVVVSMFSSCATVATEPSAPGELRLVGARFEEFGRVKQLLQYVIDLKFDSDNPVEVSRACFYWDDIGPICLDVMSVSYGERTIRVNMPTPAAGFHVLKAYVYYLKDGRIQRSNTIQTTIEITN